MAAVKGRGAVGFRDSIFVKLFGIYLATVLGVVALVLGFLQVIAPSGKADTAAKDRNRTMYVRLLADRFGDPPSLAEARRLADSLGMQVRMSGPDGEWTTAEGIPTIAALEAAYLRPSLEPNARFGRYEGRTFTLIEKDGNRFVFFFQYSPFRETRVEWIPVLAGLVALLLFLSYMLVRRLFRPLEWLNEGVREAARGNLDHGVAIRGRGELSELSTAFNDMTGRIREMIKAREQLLLDVSHELKTPLTRLKVALELGKDNLPAVVRRNVGEMETMVSELLETARLDSGPGSLNLMPLDLADLVRDMAQSFPDTRPGLRLGAVPDRLPLVADGKRVQTVLRNLFENALKYSGNQDKPVTVSCGLYDDRILLRVEDQGQGIPAAELEAVFEPFYRVDKSRDKGTGGYGLGLSLCRKILAAHGGGIDIRSEEGKGTTVTAWFPA
jgi:signal transduction histidine kinase